MSAFGRSQRPGSSSRRSRGRRARPFNSRLGLESLEDRSLLSFTPGVEFVPGELLIGFRKDVELTSIQSLYSQFGLNELRDLDRDRSDNHPGIKRLKIAQQIDARLISLLENSPWVEYAEPNYILTASDVIPNDARFNELWGLNNTNVLPQSGGTPDADIDAPEAWDIATGSSTLDHVVFVIDSGVDYLHEDLAANMWVNPGEIPGNGFDDDGNGYIDDVHGINSITGSGDPMDDNNHGTHVAGTVGAVGDNEIGVVGVNWNVKIGAAKFLGANGSGSTADAIECFNYINALKTRSANPVNVIVTNNSWSGGAFSQALMDAMNGPSGMDKILHAAAAGNANNNNDAAPTYPASYNLDNIISVAATDRNDLYASFSSYGATSVDLAAPGVSILSTTRNNSYAFFNGTSMAAPHVAGAAALIAAKYPTRTATQLKQDLMLGTDDIGSLAGNASKPTATNGRLNVNQVFLNFEESDGDGINDDPAAPNAVGNLAVSGTGTSSVTLSWNATGDDGNIGTARFYDVRYSTSAINSDSAWAAATQAVGEPRPQSPGSEELFRVTGLDHSRTYFFAVRALDNVGQESPIAAVTDTTRVAAVPFSDGFETDLTKWTAQSPWGRTTSAEHSGSWSATDSPSGNYSSNRNVSLTSMTINLSNVQDSSVSFWQRYELESSFDFGYFEVSGNNGATWSTLASYTGTNTTFHKVSFDLSAYDGNSAVKIRFRLQTDSIFRYDGWYVDDVEVVGRSTISSLPLLTIDDEPTITEDGEAVFTVTRTGSTSEPVTVHYATANGTTNPAAAGADYVGKTIGSLTIPGGGTTATATFSIPVNSDALDEWDETFFVNLFDASPNATIADEQGVGTILDDDAEPTLTVTDVTVNELDAVSGIVNADFRIILSAQSGKTVTVNYATADGSATSAGTTPDYVARPSTLLTYTAGTTVLSRIIRVTVNADTVAEGNETFFLNLSGAVNAELEDNQGVGTITEVAMPTISINNVTVTEGDSGTVSAVFTVTRTGPSDEIVTVDYYTSDATATAPGDYTEIPSSPASTLTFLPTETSKTITVAVNGDMDDEAIETFYVNLANVSPNATVEDSQGVGTITDDDLAGTLTIDDITVSEGDSGAVNATFTVTLSASGVQPVTVDFATANGSATAPADFTTTTGTLTFAAGTTTRTITIPINGDLLDEPNEEFYVILSGATNASLGDAQGRGTITDNDVAPTLSINDVSINEGNSGTKNFIFTVSLSAASGKTVTVNYATADGTATLADSDYQSAGGQLTFSPGEISKAIAVSVVGDSILESDETFSVNLSGPVEADIANGEGVGTIGDDDAVPPVSLYFSVLSDITSGALAGVANEDIVAWDGASGFSVLFDGSDVGVGGLTLDAFAILSSNEILMSFTGSGPAGSDDSDIVKFTATSLGQTTAGTFSLYFDGSDVGLTSNDEDVSAIELLPGGDLLISTTGSFSVSGVSGAAQDIIRFTPSSLGSTTAGTWQMYFDGSDVSLSSSSENVSGVALNAAGQIHLVTTGNFSVSNRSGANEDVFFTTSLTPGSSTSAVFSSALFFDGSAFGLGSNSLTGIHLPSVETGGMASTAASVLDDISSAAVIELPAKNAETLAAREQMFASYDSLNDLLVVLTGRKAGANNNSVAELPTEDEPEHSTFALAIDDVFGNGV